MSTVKGMVSLGAWEAIRGVAVWCQLMIGTKPMWIQGAEAQAKGRSVGATCVVCVCLCVCVCVCVCVRVCV